MMQTILLFAIIKWVHSFCLNYTISDSPGILSTAFSPDQSTLAIPHTSGTATFWDKNTKALKYTYLFGGWMDRISYSKNGKYIALTGAQSAIPILNSTTYAVITTINTTNLGSLIYAADFRYDDNMLLVCGNTSIVQFYNIPAWTLNRTLNTGNTIQYDCKYAPDGKFVIGGYFGTKNYEANYTLNTIYPQLNQNRVAVSVDSKYFLASLEINQFIVCTWNHSYAVYPTSYSTSDVDYSGDGKFLAISASNGKILIYNTSNYYPAVQISTGDAGGIYGARFTSDSRYLLAAGASSGKIYLYYRSDYYYLNCTQICGDLKAWTLPCDNQFYVPYDGCDNTCHVMTNFNCWVNNTVTTCSYNGLLSVDFVNISQTQNNLNQFNITINVFPPLYAFKITSQQQFIQMFTIDSANIKNIIYDKNLSDFTFVCQLNANLVNQQIIINYYPQNNVNPIYSKGQIQQFSFPLNQSIQYYPPQIYNQNNQNPSVFISVLNYNSYILLGLGFLSLIVSMVLKKLAGIQAMLVLQFSWLNFIWINSDFILPFSSIYPLKYTSGYNYNFVNENDLNFTSNQTFPYFSQFDIKSSLMINNFTFLPLLLLTFTVLAIVSYIRWKFFDHSNKIKANDSISQKKSLNQTENKNSIKLQNYKLTSYFLMCLVMLTLINFVQNSIIFFTNNQSESIHYPSLALVIITSSVIIISLVLFTKNTQQFEYVKLQFKQHKFSQQYYIFYIFFIVMSVMFLALLPQYPWPPLIPLILLIIITLVSRPYKYIKQNIRSIFNLFVMSSFVGFRVYANYTSEINCIQTYIYLLVIEVGFLSISVVGSLVSVIYSWKYEKNAQKLNSQASEQSLKTKNMISQKEFKSTNCPVQYISSKNQQQFSKQYNFLKKAKKTPLCEKPSSKTQKNLKSTLQSNQNKLGRKQNIKVNFGEKKPAIFIQQNETLQEKENSRDSAKLIKSLKYLNSNRMRNKN